MVAIAPFLISSAVSFGSSALLSLFGRNTKPITQREVNRLDSFDSPSSAYGEPIPDVYGKVRIKGIYVAAQSPPDWERDDYFDGATREWTLTYIYYGNLGVLWATNPPLDNGQEIKRIWFNRELFYSNGAVDGILGTYWGRFTGLSVFNYYGEQTSADSTLNFMGSNQIAYHGRAYSALARLRLNNSDGNLFNSRYPDLESAIDTHASGATLYLSDVIGKILEKAGYSPTEYDVAELNATALRGFKAYPGTVADKLTQLQWAYSFEVVDTGSQLKFIKANRTSSSAYIPANDLAAREDSQQRGDLFTEEINQAISELPTRVRVLFSDWENDYQPGEVLSFEIKLSENENIEEIDLSNLTLTQSEALTIANRILLLAWLRRRTYKFSLLPKYCFLEAGDVLDCEFRTGTTESVQIKRLNHGANGVLEIEAYPYDSTIYNNAYTIPASNGDTATATQGTPIALTSSPFSVSSVVGPDGTIYQVNIDYTVNLANGTVTPVIGGAITNGTSVTVIYSTASTPATPPPPLTLPPDPYAGLPRVVSFSPSQGKAGTAITIYGSGFTTATSATINGTAIAGLTVVNDTTITGTVGTGTATGKVSVTNPTGIGESLTDFVITTGSVEFADIGGFARDNADLESEIVALETAIDDNATAIATNATNIAANATAINNLSNTFGSVYIQSPTNTTIIKIPAAKGYTINSIKGVAVDSGTCTLAIKINAVAVTGLSAIAVTSTPQNVTATAANIVADGDLLTYEFSSVSSAEGFRGSLYVSI